MSSGRYEINPDHYWIPFDVADVAVTVGDWIPFDVAVTFSILEYGSHGSSTSMDIQQSWRSRVEQNTSVQKYSEDSSQTSEVGKIPGDVAGSSEENSDPEQCAICLVEFMADDLIRKLRCKHLFHKTCIDQWLTKEERCPMCRSNVVHSNESEHSNVDRIQENVVAVGEHNRDDDAVLSIFQQMDDDLLSEIASYLFDN